MAIASSATDWIGAGTAIALVVIAGGGVVARLIYRKRRHPTPLTADQAAAEKSSAYTRFDGTFLEIVEAIKQFDPRRPSAEDDLKTVRALNGTLVKVGKGSVRPSFGEQSAVAQIEREIRYGVTRAIQILDSRRSEPALPDHAAMNRTEPWLVLEHAHDLLATNAHATLQRPREVLTRIEDPYSFWDELQRFASPAHEQPPSSRP